MPPKKDSTGGGDVDYDNDTPERLNINSTLVEIADAMKTTGLNFVNKAVQGMPPSTFLAFEAVNWIMENIKGKDVYQSNFHEPLHRIHLISIDIFIKTHQFVCKWSKIDS